MSDKDLHWDFLPNDAGLTEGLNHAGIETFRGKWVQSLAREVIQNSIDADDGSSEPVRVRFSLRKNIRFGEEQLLGVFQNCSEEADNLEGDDAEKFFYVGTNALKRARRISCLAIEDFNTVGLAGKRWHMLLKAEGAGFKGDLGALGSFGIGKNAAFAASPLRTVLYSTQFTGTNGKTVRKYQGKSVLISHRDDRGKPRRGVGYYGMPKWKELSEYGSEVGGIPDEMRRTENGTSVYITAFPTEKGWQNELLKGVVQNYFLAILDGKLEVELIVGRNGVTVTRQSIYRIFDDLAGKSKNDQDFLDAHELFRCIVTDSPHDSLKNPTTSGQLSYLGHCKIWITIGEELPRKVAIIRRPGMVICNGVGLLPSLKNLPSYWSDFSAVVVCESEEGNKMLRSMEPPAHNSLETDRLGDDKREGEQALAELGRKIREWIDHQMPKPEVEEANTVDELAPFFPSEETDGDVSVGSGEPDPFGNLVVESPSERIPAVRSALRPTQEPGFEDDETGLDEGTDGTGKDNGKRKPRKRGRRTTSSGRRSRVVNVRMKRTSKDLKIAFTPEEDCIATISLSVASEDRRSDDALSIVSARDDANSEEVDHKQMELVKGKRVNLSIQTRESIADNRALILDALVPKLS